MISSTKNTSAFLKGTLLAIAALCSCLFLAQPAFAADATVSTNNGNQLYAGSITTQSSGNLFGATWSLSTSGTLTITPYPNASGDIGIAPSDGSRWQSSVYAIDSSQRPPWDSQRDSIKEVVIKSGVTFIGSFAFDQCANLNTVSIPSSVKTIEEGAFQGCKLENLTIGNGVKRIGNYAFYGCEFQSVTIPASVTSIGAYAFTLYPNCLKTVVFKGDAPAYSGEDYAIVEYSGNYPFSNQKATAYYPAGNSTWTKAAKGKLSGPSSDSNKGVIKWRAVNTSGNVQKVSLSTCTLKLSKTSLRYTGKARKVGVTVMDMNYKLKAGTDYTVKFSNNKKVGKAKVTITGKGEYSGTKTATFNILKGINTLTAKTKTVKVSYSKVKKANVTLAKTKAFTVTKNKGTVVFKKASGTNKIVVSKTGKVTLKKGLSKGTHTVKVKITASGNANYLKATKTVKLKVKIA